MHDGPSGGHVIRLGENVMGKIASGIVALTLATSSAFVAGAGKSREWSNRRWCSGRTYRRSVAGRRPGSTACSSSAAAGLLCAGTGLRRRAGLPFGPRALLGWIWLAVSPSPGLRLIAAPLDVLGLNKIKSDCPRAIWLVWPPPNHYLRPSMAKAGQSMAIDAPSSAILKPI